MAAATALIPVPGLDFASLAAVEATMMSRIAAVYGQSLGTESARAAVALVLGVLLPSVGNTALMGIAAKLVPGAGLLFATTPMAAINAAGTYAIGKVFIAHFEQGGVVADFRPESLSHQIAIEIARAGTPAGA